MPRYRWHDTAPSPLEIKFARWRKRRAAERACATCDAEPDLATIQAFYRNALRSSGDPEEAREKTMRMYDLDDLKCDGERVVGFYVADEADPDDPVDPDLDRDEAAGSMASAQSDHLGALRALNSHNSRRFARPQPARDTEANAHRQPTPSERKALSPAIGIGTTANGLLGLKAFNTAAKRLWGT